MRRLAPVVAVLLLPFTVAPATATTSTSGSAPVAGVGTQVDIDVPTITWGPCKRLHPPAECDTVELPLDYDAPDGPTTTVNLSRLPATGERIGSLFVNPGGPGLSAYDFATHAGELIGPGVSEHFDVVGVEPRGIAYVAYQAPAVCRVPRGDAPEYPRVPYPLTDGQERATIRADRALNDDCADHRSRITDHMSTADYARDVDVVRQALGEDQLTFYGISYGSIVGQTYAAMFPDRVRAIIVDGVLDPVEWTSGRRPERPSTFRMRSGQGSYEALVTAFNECDRVGPLRCALAGHAKQTWLHLYRLALRGELKIGRGRIPPQTLTAYALAALYSAEDIPSVMRFLNNIERRLDGRAGATSASTSASVSARDELERIRQQRDRIGPYGAGPATAGQADYGRRGVGREAVVCSDAVNPTDPQAWRHYSDVADKTQPWFGRTWTWASSLCAGWPGSGGEDAFRGPWPTTTSTPLLIVGNTHDPATPISGARAANRLFAGSVLLTLDGWGHGALDHSTCVSKKMAAYLINQTLPTPSTHCKPDQPLFH